MDLKPCKAQETFGLDQNNMIQSSHWTESKLVKGPATSTSPSSWFGLHYPLQLPTSHETFLSFPGRGDHNVLVKSRQGPGLSERHKAIKPQLPRCPSVAFQGQNVPDFKSSLIIWYLSLGRKNCMIFFQSHSAPTQFGKVPSTYFCVISPLCTVSLVSWW